MHSVSAESDVWKGVVIADRKLQYDIDPEITHSNCCAHYKYNLTKLPEALKI